MFKTIERRLRRLEKHQVNTITYKLCDETITVPNTKQSRDMMVTAFLQAMEDVEREEKAKNMQ